MAAKGGQPPAAAQVAGTDDVDAKVVLLGDTGVGKTSLAVRYVNEQFSTRVQPTIGASFSTKRVVVDGCKIKLQIWDTAGQERFRSLAPMYYRGAVAAILVYDMTNEGSFATVKDWVQELRVNVQEEIIMCIVGNKCDMAQYRKVPNETAVEYANSIGAIFYEASAKSNQGIDIIFVDIAKKLQANFIKHPPKAGKNSSLYQIIQASDGENGQADAKPKRSCCMGGS